jgi:hypothetical protein
MLLARSMTTVHPGLVMEPLAVEVQYDAMRLYDTLPVDVDPELLVGVEHAGRAANIDLML